MRLSCSLAGKSFGDPFGNHSRFQVVTRIGDAASAGAANASKAATRLRMLR
jgi:hypothetical protein